MDLFTSSGHLFHLNANHNHHHMDSMETGTPVHRGDVDGRRARIRRLRTLLRFRSERNIRLSESGRGRFELRYSVVDPGLYEVKLRIYDLRKAEMVFESKEHLIGVQPKWEFTHDRSYYTSENEIRFRSRMNRSEKPGSSGYRRSVSSIPMVIRIFVI